MALEMPSRNLKFLSIGVTNWAPKTLAILLIVRERLALAISPRILSNFFIQYNDLAEVLSVNLRFNWIYRPGEDLFVVYNQSWNAPGLSDLSKRDRQFIVKFTYLFQK